MADLRGHDQADRIRLFIERLASIGLLNTPPDSQSSRQPSFFPPFLPPLLAHLHPDPSSPLPPYGPTFLPAVFLPLPASTLSSFVSSLLRYLCFRLGGRDLKPGSPNDSIHRAIVVLGQILGSAKVGGEAWEAVMRALLTRKSLSVSMDGSEHAKSRLIAGWVNSAGDIGQCFVPSMFRIY
jgi:telomere length regulation protein